MRDGRGAEAKIAGVAVSVAGGCAQVVILGGGGNCGCSCGGGRDLGGSVLKVSGKGLSL